VASHKSALKRIKQTSKANTRNREHVTKLRHQMRRINEVLKTKDKAAVDALLKPTLALIDHSVRKGVLHRNAAARHKSRLTLKFNALA